MTLKYIYNRFHQMKHDYIGETSFVRTCWLWLGWINNAILYGASISDYFALGFYKMQHSGKQEYVIYRRYKYIQKIANSTKDIHICRSKIDFNNYFADVLGREWLDMNTVTENELKNFLDRHEYFFLKDIFSFRGIGVKKMCSKDITIDTIGTFIRDCRKDPKIHYIIEEPLTEIASLQEFHPNSINTLRVVTFYDTQNGKVHFMNARLRMGNNYHEVDNFHYEGIAAQIDINTGIVKAPGYDSRNNVYMIHPVSKKQIIGFQIPYWQECKEFIDKTARLLPTVRYVGWDLVIQDNGHFALIEANDNADYDSQQLHNKGFWKEYKQLLTNIK